MTVTGRTQEFGFGVARSHGDEPGVGVGVARSHGDEPGVGVGVGRAATALTQERGGSEDVYPVSFQSSVFRAVVRRKIP